MNTTTEQSNQVQQKSKDALSRISELERNLTALDQLVKTNLKLYADLFNKLGETLLQTEDKTAAFEQLLGPEAVSAIVKDRQETRKKQQEAAIQKRMEEEKLFISTGLENEFLTTVSTVSQNTVIVGQQFNGQGAVVGLERQQFLLSQVNAQIQALFLAKGLEVVTLPQDETFKINELYDLNIEKYTQWMKVQQDELNKSLSKVSTPVDPVADENQQPTV